MSSDRSMRVLLLFLESKAEDQVAVTVQDKILAVLSSEEDATSLSDSRFKLKELRQSSIGKKSSRGHQAFIDLVDELVAKHLGTSRSNNAGEDHDTVRHLRLQELEECQAFKWPLSTKDATALGGLVKGCLTALQSTVYPAEAANTQTHASNDIPAVKANTDSREASKCDTLFLRECTRTRSVPTCRGAQTSGNFELSTAKPSVPRKLSSQVSKLHRVPTR